MEMSQSVSQALGLIDNELERIQSREIISSTEVSDLLLDIRLALMQSESVEKHTATAVQVHLLELINLVKITPTAAPAITSEAWCALTWIREVATKAANAL